MYKITREDCDNYAYQTQQRWKAGNVWRLFFLFFSFLICTFNKQAFVLKPNFFTAHEAGHYTAEIAPIDVKARKGKVSMAQDEHPRPQTTLEQMAKLPTVFKKGGTVTAANASVSWHQRCRLIFHSSTLFLLYSAPEQDVKASVLLAIVCMFFLSQLCFQSTVALCFRRPPSLTTKRIFWSPGCIGRRRRCDCGERGCRERTQTHSSGQDRCLSRVRLWPEHYGNRWATFKAGVKSVRHFSKRSAYVKRFGFLKCS